MTARPPALPWAHPTMLAPMQGVTSPTFRALAAEGGGVGIVCTEFVRVSRAPISAAALARCVVKVPGLPLCVQVMGRDADKMADAAAAVSDAGADVVDVNLGCPTSRAARKGVGAAMLKDPVLVSRVLGAMRPRVRGLLSAKIRAGFDDDTSVLALAEVLQDAGVDLLVVHPRRRADLYRGVADWRIVRLLARRLDVPVVGNGDLWYAADALRLERESGCAGVMLGRPALRNPFIFRQIADLRAGREAARPSGADVFAYLLQLRGRYRRSHRAPIGRMKEVIRWVGRALDDERAFLRRALRLRDLDEIMRLCERVLSPLPAGRLDLDAQGSLGLERRASALIDVAQRPAPAQRHLLCSG